MNLILISLAVASISVTITKSTLFSSFREVFNWKLFQCPYCMSHWVSIIAVVHYFPIDLDIVINVFAVVTLSSFSAYILLCFLDLSDE